MMSQIDSEKFLPVTNFKMAATIPHKFNIVRFQSGPVPGTFTHLRSCIVPAEITEPPKISSGQYHKYDWLVEYFS